MNTYYVWTNYANWRINLELIGGYEIEEKTDAEQIEDLAREFIGLNDSDNNSLMSDYAAACLSEVNWHEIAEALNEVIIEP